MISVGVVELQNDLLRELPFVRTNLFAHVIETVT